MREFLRGLELDPETIDAIMAEFGKSVTKDKEEIQDLKGQISELRQSSDVEWKKKFEELDNQIKDQEAKKQAENQILESIGNKQFTSDYAKQGFINDVKTALSNPENEGKGINDLVVEIAKDKKGVFTNPNEFIDVPGANENVETNISKDAFDKMSYNERLQLKQDNPELFRKLNV